MTDHPALQLPPKDLQLRQEKDNTLVFDPCRKKYIKLNPEEWVRQHFLHFLIDHRGYPASLIQVEGGLYVNQLQKRSDLVVYDRTGKPWMLIECKAYSIAIVKAHFQQAAMYNSTLGARYITLTNGMEHHCFQIDQVHNKLLTLADLPGFPK